MLFVILGGEVAFWLFVVGGLVSRYTFGKKKMGLFLLSCTPVIDLLVLLFTGIDLKNGAEANYLHGLAAIYIGVTVVYGKSMIRWADQRFAYRYKKGSKAE